MQKQEKKKFLRQLQAIRAYMKHQMKMGSQQLILTLIII